MLSRQYPGGVIASREAPESTAAPRITRRALARARPSVSRHAQAARETWTAAGRGRRHTAPRVPAAGRVSAPSAACPARRAPCHWESINQRARPRSTGIAQSLHGPGFPTRPPQFRRPSPSSLAFARRVAAAFALARSRAPPREPPPAPAPAPAAAPAAAMALTTLPSWLALPLSLATLVIATAKTWRVRTYVMFIPLALLQAVAVGAAIVALVSPLFPIADAGGLSAVAPFLLAAGAAACAALVDLAVSLRFVRTAATPDRSLNARTTILLSLMPLALAFAGLFRISWDWGLAEFTPPPEDAADYPVHALFALGGVAIVIVSVVAAALVAAMPAPGGGVRGDRCARVWFGLMFFCAPASAVITGVASLLAPKEVSGGFVVLHVVLGTGVVTMSAALMRDMLNNGMYVDPIGGGGDKLVIPV